MALLKRKIVAFKGMLTAVALQQFHGQLPHVVLTHKVQAQYTSHKFGLLQLK